MKQHSITVKQGTIANVATISGNDKEIGELIAEAMDKVGKDGVITVEESKGIETMNGRGHAVRPRLHLPLLRHQRRAMEAELEDPTS